MKKHIFFLHSAGAQGLHEGSSDLVAWLKKELGSDYEITHPVMPHPEAPDYESWKPVLQEKFAKLENGVLFIGHSLGGSVLLKFLSEEKIAISINSLFLIAVPFWGGDENWQHPPFHLRADFPRTLPRIPRTFLYHAKQDPIVSFTHLAMYANKLPQATSRELEGNEHVYADGVPRLLEDIRISSAPALN